MSRHKGFMDKIVELEEWKEYKEFKELLKKKEDEGKKKEEKPKTWWGKLNVLQQGLLLTLAFPILGPAYAGLLAISWLTMKRILQLQ